MGSSSPKGDASRARNRATYLLEQGLCRARSLGLLEEGEQQREPFLNEFLGVARRVGTEITEMGLRHAETARETNDELGSVRILVELLTAELTAPNSTFPDTEIEALQARIGMGDDLRAQVEYDLLAALRQLARRGSRDPGAMQSIRDAVRLTATARLTTDGHDEALRAVTDRLEALLGSA